MRNSLQGRYNSLSFLCFTALPTKLYAITRKIGIAPSKLNYNVPVSKFNQTFRKYS